MQMLHRVRYRLVGERTVLINHAVILHPQDHRRLANIKQARNRAIRAARARLIFLLPYSPDLNPIEMVFAKLKTLLRTADERSIAAVWHRNVSLLENFGSTECANYLRHAEYDQTDPIILWVASMFRRGVRYVGLSRPGIWIQGVFGKIAGRDRSSATARRQSLWPSVTQVAGNIDTWLA